MDLREFIWMKIEILVKDRAVDIIVYNALIDMADLCAEEITGLLDKLETDGLPQYKLKDLNDSAATLSALLTVLKYCSVEPEIDSYEAVLNEYGLAVGLLE